MRQGKHADSTELDSILGHRPASAPAALLDTETTDGNSTAKGDTVVEEKKHQLMVNFDIT